MKTLFKTVFAALVAVFLSISLSGCFDEGSKTTSQGRGSIFSGTTSADSFVIPAGAAGLVYKFRSREIMRSNKDKIGKMLSQKVSIFKIEDGGDIEPMSVFYLFRPLSKKVSVFIDTSLVFQIEVIHTSGMITSLWDISRHG